jgi:hypothetical protein
MRRAMALAAVCVAATEAFSPAASRLPSADSRCVFLHKRGTVWCIHTFVHCTSWHEDEADAIYARTGAAGRRAVVRADLECNSVEGD